MVAKCASQQQLLIDEKAAQPTQQQKRPSLLTQGACHKAIALYKTERVHAANDPACQRSRVIKSVLAIIFFSCGSHSASGARTQSGLQGT